MRSRSLLGSIDRSIDRFLARPSDRPAITIIDAVTRNIGNVGILRAASISFVHLSTIRRNYATGVSFIYGNWENLFAARDITPCVYTIGQKFGIHVADRSGRNSPFKWKSNETNENVESSTVCCIDSQFVTE